MSSENVDPGERMKCLIATRNLKMAVSAHAYVRGSTTRYYEWLEASNGITLPNGPAVWICGDCHVGNLGPVASTNGSLAIQIRDLDQTVIGNPAHDIIRLGLSMAMAARGSGLPGVITAHMMERIIDGYEAAFASDAQGETIDASSDMPKPVRTLMRQAAGRSWKHLADERIEGIDPVIPLGKRFWPLTPDERAAVEALFAEDALHRLATLLRSREDDAPVRVMDAAYWRKGCSSLGRLRVAVLVVIGKGKNERHCLMDVKEAISAAAPRRRSAVMPADNAERVVTGARAISPFLGRRMLSAHLLGKSVFIRELLPQDLKLEIERLSRDEAVGVAGFLAHVIGRAHARQMDAAGRKEWLADLKRNRSASLDAPSWLWNSVVDLVAAHEAAYLEHCRRHALKDGALKEFLEPKGRPASRFSFLQLVNCRHVADHANNGGFTMSDAGTMATGAPNETRDAGPKLYGASGEPLHSGSRSSPDKIDPLAGFVKRRPFTSEPVALVIGYLLGNIT